MSGTPSEREEIDRLIERLTEAEKAKARASMAPAKPRPVGRWSNGQLSMPAAPAAAPAPGRAATLIAAIPVPALPELPDLTRVFRAPGQMTMVRLWVGLAASHSAAMTVWPYPTTSLPGFALYVLSIGLTLVASIWGAKLSWDARLGSAHTVALGSMVWGIALGAAEIARQFQGF